MTTIYRRRDSHPKHKHRRNMTTDVTDIFDGMLEGVDEENLQQRDPIGTFDCVLMTDASWSYKAGTNDDGEDWVITAVNVHVKVLRDVKNDTGKSAVGRHFFPNARYNEQKDALARALSLPPVEVTNSAGKTFKSYIRGLTPTYIPADAENAFDGGVIEGTAGRRIRVRVYLGKAKPVRGTDEMRSYPGYAFSTIPTRDLDLLD